MSGKGKGRSYSSAEKRSFKNGLFTGLRRSLGKKRRTRSPVKKTGKC